MLGLTLKEGEIRISNVSKISLVKNWLNEEYIIWIYGGSNYCLKVFGQDVVFDLLLWLLI